MPSPFGVTQYVVSVLNTGDGIDSSSMENLYQETLEGKVETRAVTTESNRDGGEYPQSVSILKSSIVFVRMIDGHRIQYGI